MKEVTKERNRPTYSGKQYKQHQHREKIFLENHINAIKSKNKHKDNTSNISTVKHFLENHINAIKCKNKHKDNVKSRLQIDASKTLSQWLMNVNS